MIPVTFMGGTGIAHKSDAMRILLCSEEPILLKNLYGILRDEGWEVETVSHPALAIQTLMKTDYKAVIFDSGVSGMSVKDAVHIIRSFLPEMIIFTIGNMTRDPGVTALSMPADLGEIKEMVHNVKQVA